MGVVILCLAALIVANGAAHPDPPDTSAPERPAVGILLGPGLDGSDPWFFTGVRVTIPATDRISLDLESSAVPGGGNDFARIHGWHAAQLRFLRTPESRGSRYWLAGVAVMPGDKLRLDGSIRDERHYTAALIGIGGRELVGRGFRISGEASAYAGDGFGVRALTVVQWGR